MAKKIVVLRPKMNLIPGDYVQTIGITPSQSRPGLLHVTLKMENGTIVCSCDAWQFNNTCWHAKELDNGGKAATS